MKSLFQLAKSLVLAFILVLTTYGFLPAAAILVDADRQYQYAQHLYQQGRYLLSGTEYQRFAFFFPEDSRARLAVFNSGRAYFQAGNFPSALAQFQALTDTNELDAVSVDAYFMLAELHMKANEPGRALIVLHNLKALSQDQTLQDRALVRMGWIHIDRLDWPSARLAFEQISPDGHITHGIDDLLNALNTSESLQFKTPALAGALSIVPGLGQLYCGRYEDALIAFLVDVGLFWGAYESFDNDLNVLGSLLSVVGVGFYTSNIYGAVSSAHKYNIAQKHRFVDQLHSNFKISLGASPNVGGHNLALTMKIEF